MLVQTTTSGVATVAIASLLSFTPAQAAMTPPLHSGVASIQHVDCAVGFHIGDGGVCIIGAEEHHDRVVAEPRPGCETKSVTRSDDTGSVTKTQTNCD